MNGNKYDLIVSIGEDCACSAFLRNNKLQFPSFPFDWLMHANFETRVNLLMTNFSDFLNKDDVIPLEKTGEDVDKKCDYYQNRKNGFYYYHDFPEESDFNTSFPIVKEKYQRRINRLYQKIESAKKSFWVGLVERLVCLMKN